MFDPKAFSLAQIRCEEMRHQAEFERSLGLPQRQTVLHKRLLAAAGRHMIHWGSALESRYGEARQRAVWSPSRNRMERAL